MFNSIKFLICFTSTEYPASRDLIECLLTCLALAVTVFLMQSAPSCPLTPACPLPVALTLSVVSSLINLLAHACLTTSAARPTVGPSVPSAQSVLRTWLVRTSAVPTPVPGPVVLSPHVDPLTTDLSVRVQRDSLAIRLLDASPDVRISFVFYSKYNYFVLLFPGNYDLSTPTILVLSKCVLCFYQCFLCSCCNQFLFGFCLLLLSLASGALSVDD